MRKDLFRINPKVAPSLIDLKVRSLEVRSRTLEGVRRVA